MQPANPKRLPRYDLAFVCAFIVSLHLDMRIHPFRQSTGNHIHVTTVLGYQQALSRCCWCLLLIEVSKTFFYSREKLSATPLVCLFRWSWMDLPSSSPFFLFSSRSSFQKRTRGDDCQWAIRVDSPRRRWGRVVKTDLLSNYLSPLTDWVREMEGGSAHKSAMFSSQTGHTHKHTQTQSQQWPTANQPNRR